MKVGPPGILFALRHSKTPERNGKEDFDADGYSPGLLGTILSRQMCDRGLLHL